MPSLADPRVLVMEGEVDPFDSLDSMIKHEDLQKFVLFKTHYRKYMDVSVAYDDLMSRLECFEEELDHAKSQETKALDDLETLRNILREKETVLQRKEDELFAADERITQLECELEEERGLRASLKKDLVKLEEAKQALNAEVQASKREKSEIQLRFQVEKSKCSEDEITRSSENTRLIKGLEEMTKEKERWRQKWEDLYAKVRTLESQWRESRELQGLLRAGIQHLAQCSRPSTCKMCSRVRDSYGIGLVGGNSKGASNGVLPSNGRTEVTTPMDSRRKQANWLRGQYQRLCHTVGTLLPAPMATFDPGLEDAGSDPAVIPGMGTTNDSGFVEGVTNGAATGGGKLERRKSFDGVVDVMPSKESNGSIRSPTSNGSPHHSTPPPPASNKTPTSTTSPSHTHHRSPFHRMSRLTKSFGHSDNKENKLRMLTATSTTKTLRVTFEEGDVEEEEEALQEDGGGATPSSVTPKHHKMGPVRKFFSRMSVR